MIELIENWCDRLRKLPLAEQVEALNAARKLMHEAGPFVSEPVDYGHLIGRSLAGSRQNGFRFRIGPRQHGDLHAFGNAAVWAGSRHIAIHTTDRH